jgi:pimeloyl-ACP methyl ester carboxylesterase
MRLRVGDLYLNAADEGEGRVVLFLHGLGANHRNWEAQLDAFRGDFRCVAPDWRGAGDSDSPPAPYDYVMMADDLDGLCEKMGIARAVVVGQSMGGSIAQVFALRHPGRVEALALVATVCRSVSGSAETYAEAKAVIGREGLGPIPGMYLDQVYPKTFQDAHPGLVARFRRELLNYRPEGLLAAMSAGTDFDLQPELPAIVAPTLVIVGAQDAICRPEESALIARLIPHARLVTLPDCGHQPHVEHPGQFNAVLRSFIDERG